MDVRTLNHSLFGFLLVVFIVCSTSLGTYFGFQQLVVLGILPLLTVFSLLFFGRSFDKFDGKELLIFLIFVLVSMVAVYQGIDYGLFVVEFRKIVSSLFAAAVGLLAVRYGNQAKNIHLAFIISSLVLIFMTYLNGNFKVIGFTSLGVGRDAFFFNPNYYSYITFFANISLLYLHLKKRTVFLTVLCLILPALFLIMAFVTQSRAGLLFTLLVNIMYWFFIVPKKQKNPFGTIFRSIFILGFSVFIGIQIASFYSGSNIAKRVEKSERDSRTDLAERGLELFVEHPILGVGLGQFPLYTPIRQFTHNSYAEALSEHGIVGGSLMIFILVYPFIKSLKLFIREPKNPFLKIQLLFFFSFLLYNNFYVFYKFPYGMLYFFMFVALQQKMISKTLPNTAK